MACVGSQRDGMPGRTCRSRQNDREGPDYAPSVATNNRPTPSTTSRAPNGQNAESVYAPLGKSCHQTQNFESYALTCCRMLPFASVAKCRRLSSQTRLNDCAGATPSKSLRMPVGW